MRQNLCSYEVVQNLYALSVALAATLDAALETSALSKLRIGVSLRQRVARPEVRRAWNDGQNHHAHRCGSKRATPKKLKFDKAPGMGIG